MGKEKTLLSNEMRIYLGTRGGHDRLLRLDYQANQAAQDCQVILYCLGYLSIQTNHYHPVGGGGYTGKC